MVSTVVACSTATRSVSAAVPAGSCRTSTATGEPPSAATERRRSPSRTGPAALMGRSSSRSCCAGSALGEGGGRAGPGPRQELPKAVLYGRLAVGQLIHRLGDSRLPLPAERHLGQALVNLHAA